MENLKDIFGYEPSSYQLPILNEVINGKGHLLINAKAGSGKTSTLKMICEVAPKTSKILNLAFNKKIADEMSAKIQKPNVECSTIHSRGFSTLKSKLSTYGKYTGNPSKGYAHKTKFIDRHAQDWNWVLPIETYESLKEKSDTVRDLIDLIRLSLCGMQKEGENVIQKCYERGLFASMTMAQLAKFMRERLGVEDKLLELCEKHDIVFGDNEHFKAFQIVLEMLKEFIGHFEGKTIGKTVDIDFVDMVFLPSVLDFYIFQEYDLVLVDECQDLSACTLQLIKKYVSPTGRMIFVGDKGQAIYGFAGSDSASFQNISEIENVKAFPLNECYRCGKDIINFVRMGNFDNEIIPFSGNGKGEVQMNSSYKEIQSGDLVLCRMTFPLVKLCYQLIGEGKGANVLGKDIGASIINLYKKCKSQNIVDVIAFMQKEIENTYRKLCKMYPDLTPQQIFSFPSYESMQEKVAIVELIISNNGTVTSKDTLTARIESIFTDNIGGGITLSTVHKAKGAEADRVFIIENELMPHKRAKKDWQREQEKNLQYVAYTRAKHYLGFVTDWKSSKENISSSDEEDEE